MKLFFRLNLNYKVRFHLIIIDLKLFLLKVYLREF
jgi:hypothetical protein